jgi:hypothetical protein
LRLSPRRLILEFPDTLQMKVWSMAMDRGVVDQQLEALGAGSRWWDERELRDLPHILTDDEEILAIARGKLARVRVMRRSWLLVVTQRRLLCMRSGSRAGWRQLEYGAPEISRVSLRVGPFRGRVLVAAGDQTLRLLVPRADAYRLHAALFSLCNPGRLPERGFQPSRMVHRVIDHVLALPAAALAPDPPRRTAAVTPFDPAAHEAHEARLDLLEAEVQELRRQVDFLEQLLRRPPGATPLPVAREPDR